MNNANPRISSYEDWLLASGREDEIIDEDEQASYLEACEANEEVYQAQTYESQSYKLAGGE